MDVHATTPGLYPLPDWAKEDLSDLKGHQRGDMVSGEESEAVRAVYDEVRAELVGLQREAGLDRVVEGQARWDDMLAHPLAVHDSVETRGIVRYYDNNNFYREPVVTGPLTADGDLAVELGALADLAEHRQVVLPGPYTLARLATDDYYGDEAAFLDGVADFLAGELADVPAAETLLLLEPSLVTDPPGDGLDERASEAVDRVAGAVDAEVFVQSYFGSVPEKVHAHLLDAGVDGLGYDLVAAPEDALYLMNEYGTRDAALFGVVDGQNTVEEGADTVADRLRWVASNTPGVDLDRAVLTANTPLFYLPYSTFQAKLAALADGRDRATDTPDADGEADTQEVDA
jgi:5-methyltetrahydropteroyltriglutamate--homocysteine methyltransferase